MVGVSGGRCGVTPLVRSESGGKPFSKYRVGLAGKIVTCDFKLGGKRLLGDKWSYGEACYGYRYLGHRFNVDFTLGISIPGGSYKNLIPWTVTMYSEPLKPPLVRPDQGRYLGVVGSGGGIIAGRKEGRWYGYAFSGCSYFMDGTDGLSMDFMFDHPHFATVRVIFDWIDFQSWQTWRHEGRILSDRWWKYRDIWFPRRGGWSSRRTITG